MRSTIRTALVALPLAVALALGPAAADETPASAAAPDAAVADSAVADSAAEPTARWHTELDTAVAEAKVHGRYILVDLFADWCGWCHRLEDEVFTHPDFVEYVQDFTLLRVDTEDGAVGSWLQLRYGASSLPTTLVLDADLVRVGKIQGYAPMPTFVQYVQEQVNGYLNILSFYDQLLVSEDAELQRRVADDLLDRGAGSKAAILYQRVLEQVRGGTDAEAWLTYQLADAYRIGREFEAARQHLGQAMTLAKHLDPGSGVLIERLDLLKVHVAQESGDCEETLTSLRHFLHQHPASSHASYAEQTLDAIEQGKMMEQCT